MTIKPNHISVEDWDSVDIPDMSDISSEQMFHSSATSAQGIMDDVMRQYRGKQKATSKQSTTIRLPSDVIQFFKAGSKDGKG